MRATKMMPWTERRPMFNFLRKTALWILLLPIVTFGVGAASNQVVLMANHDKFPVMINQKKIDKRNAAINAAIAAGEVDADDVQLIGIDGMIDDTHCVMTPYTHLNALADVFDFKTAIYSVGDGLLYLGEWLSAFCMFIWGYVVVDKLRKTA